jgi:hypothetical protein
MWKPPANASWQSATTPEQFERLMWDAIKRGDLKEVTAHLSSTFVVVAPDGRRDRAAQLEHLRKIHLTGYEISDLESAPAGDNMVVTYTLALHGTFSGPSGSPGSGDQPIPEQPWRVMTIWRVAPHTWVAVAQSVTPARTSGQ